MKKLLPILALLLASATAQATAQTFPQITTQKLTFNGAPAPQPVSQATVQLVGNPGNQTYYVWIVANFAVGNATPSQPFMIRNAPVALSASNYLFVSWSAITGATGYDVLLTTTDRAPSGACGCAAATGVAGTTENITSSTTSAYTVNTYNGSPVFELDNFAGPLVFRYNAGEIAHLTAGGTFYSGSNPLSGISGSPTTGDCVDFASATTIQDAGAPCGSGGGGVILQTNGTNNASQSLLNLVAGTGITLANTSGGDVSVTASGGGASAGSGTLQVSNGSGGFATNGYFKADTTNGYLANLNPSAQTPGYPLDVEWTGQTGTSAGFTLAQLNCGLASTAATSPGDLHCMNLDGSLGGTNSGTWTSLTDSLLYMDLTDSRAPGVATTVGHMMPVYAQATFAGGANLTDSIIAGLWGTADFAGVGGTASQLIALNGEMEVSGSGSVTQAVTLNAPMATAASGPALDSVYGILTSDPAAVQHGTGGSGCVAAVSLGTCSSGTYTVYSPSTAGGAFSGGLVLGATALGGLGGTRGVVGDFQGGVNVGNAGGGTHPPLCFYSYSTGSPTTCINAISGTQSLRLPSDSVTLNGTAGSYDVASHTGNISAQTLFAFPDGQSRFFRLDVYGTCTTAVASSTVTISVAYTDEVQAQTQSSSAETCAAAGDILTYSTVLYANTANVTVSTTTTNSPVYDLHARLVLLGPNSINSQ